MATKAPVVVGATTTTQSLILAHFARAVDGAPDPRAPDIDEHGFLSSTTEGDFRAAQGPVVGISMGVPRCRVMVVRDHLDFATTLAVTLRHVSGPTNANLAVSFHNMNDTATLPAFTERDCVYLETSISGSEQGTAGEQQDDQRHADAEWFNELILIGTHTAARNNATAAMEARATRANRRRHFTVNAGETQAAALERNINDGSPSLYDQQSARRDDASLSARQRRVAGEYVDWMDAELVALDNQRSVANTNDRWLQQNPIYVAQVAAGGDVNRLIAVRDSWIRGKLAEYRKIRWAQQNGPSDRTLPEQYVVELRVGGPTGPIIGELGVNVYVPLLVDVACHIVSIGAGAQDRTHLTYSYDQIAIAFYEVNAIYQPAGVRFIPAPWVTERYRVAPTSAQHHNTTADDPDGRNTFIANWSKLFLAGFVPFSDQSTQLTANLMGGRGYVWQNIVANAGVYADHALNVYFLNDLAFLYDSGFTLLGVGLSHRTMDAGAANAPGAAQVSPVTRVNTPNGPMYALFVQSAAQPFVNVQLGQDRVSLWCKAVTADQIAHLMAHEIGHVMDLKHYRSGERGMAPPPADQILYDLWANRNTMHNFTNLFFRAAGANQKYPADVVDVRYGSMLPGSAFTIKKYNFAFTGVAATSFNPATTQVAIIRDTVIRGKYHNS